MKKKKKKVKLLKGNKIQEDIKRTLLQRFKLQLLKYFNNNWLIQVPELISRSIANTSAEAKPKTPTDTKLPNKTIQEEKPSRSSQPENKK